VVPLQLPLVPEPDLAAIVTAAVEAPELALLPCHGQAGPGNAESREEKPGRKVHATRRRSVNKTSELTVPNMT
jgi:hypothetical protein